LLENDLLLLVKVLEQPLDAEEALVEQGLFLEASEGRQQALVLYWHFLTVNYDLLNYY